MATFLINYYCFDEVLFEILYLICSSSIFLRKRFVWVCRAFISSHWIHAIPSTLCDCAPYRLLVGLGSSSLISSPILAWWNRTNSSRWRCWQPVVARQTYPLAFSTKAFAYSVAIQCKMYSIWYDIYLKSPLKINAIMYFNDFRVNFTSSLFFLSFSCRWREIVFCAFCLVMMCVHKS